MGMTLPVVSAPNEIEVGAADGTLRLMLAKEGLRQAEALFKAQADALSGMQTRSTALLGWTVTVLSALVATFWAPSFLVPAVGAAVSLTVAACYCLSALWPRSWSNAAWNPSWFLQCPHDTELEVIEAMVSGAVQAIADNEQNLRSIARRLRSAYASFALAPLVGSLLLLLTSSATPP